MVVIKTFDTAHGHIYEAQKETSFEEAVSSIKKRKECGDTGQIEFDYIGEKGVVDFDISALKCPVCRELAKMELRAERER